MAQNNLPNSMFSDTYTIVQQFKQQWLLKLYVAIIRLWYSERFWWIILINMDSCAFLGMVLMGSLLSQSPIHLVFQKCPNFLNFSV